MNPRKIPSLLTTASGGAALRTSSLILLPMIPGVLEHQPNPSQLWFVTDHLDSPADFLLQRVLNAVIKSSSDRGLACILVSTTQNFDRYKAIAARSVSRVASASFN